MADIADVEIALVAGVLSALYPNGQSAKSVADTTCRVYRGWPLQASLNSDLSNGVVNVSVSSSDKVDEILPPYLNDVTAIAMPCTLRVTVDRNTVTFSGIPAADQIAGVLVDGVPYVYRVSASDTTESVASNLSVQLPAGHLAAVAGSAIAFPGARRLIARAFADGRISSRLRRHRKSVKVACWCPSPPLRDLVAAAADAFLGSLRTVALPDGTAGLLRYQSTDIYDQSQSAFLFRRDLNYTCVYDLTAVVDKPTMLFGRIASSNGTVTV